THPPSTWPCWSYGWRQPDALLCARTSRGGYRKTSRTTSPSTRRPRCRGTAEPSHCSISPSIGWSPSTSPCPVSLPRREPRTNSPPLSSNASFPRSESRLRAYVDGAGERGGCSLIVGQTNWGAGVSPWVILQLLIVVLCCSCVDDQEARDGSVRSREQAVRGGREHRCGAHASRGHAGVGGRVSRRSTTCRGRVEQR